MLDFTKGEKALFNRLSTPAKIQDFLNKIPINFEKNGETLKSPVQVLRTGSAHCFEGALLGAYILWRHGYPPLVLSLGSSRPDFDHVIAPFKYQSLWGALSKTNHAVLRYREPVYKNIRELVMSYFHEYFTDAGVKTLTKYSEPFNLNSLNFDWATAGDDLWQVDEVLDKLKYFDVASPKVLKNLRRADRLERQAGKLVDFRPRK